MLRNAAISPLSCLWRRMGLRMRLISVGVLGAMLLAAPVSGQTFKVGSFTKSGDAAPATQTVTHNLGVVPKALILWTSGKTTEVIGASYTCAFGMTDGTTSYSASWASINGGKKSNASRRMAPKLLNIVQWGEVTLAEADLTSWNETTFTVTWTTNNSSQYIVHYLLIGGDISAKVVTWQMPARTGSRPVTGVGFQPDVVLHAHLGYDYGTMSTAMSGAGFGLGAMNGSGSQWAFQVFTGDADNNSDTQRGQQTDAALYSIDGSLQVKKEASFASMDSDGFTVNFSSASPGAGWVASLALSNVNALPGSFLKTTAAAPAGQPVTGLSVNPQAVLLASFQDITQGNPVVHTRLGLGASDGTTEGGWAIADAEKVGTTSVWAIDKTSKVFMKVNNDTQTVDAEADVSGFDTGKFTLNWTTNDTVETQILYLAFGQIHAFGYMKSITIDRTKVGVPATGNTTISNFPVLIDCADVNLATTANGGNVTSPYGYDIVFRSRDDTACGGPGTAPCQLDHEIERYVATTGRLTAWVSVPVLNTNAAASDTVIWVYYGNPDVTTSLENPGGVWDTNFRAVWHLADNEANTTVKESTSYANTGTAAASTSTKSTDGRIGSALTFNGTNDYIYTTTAYNSPSSVTVSAWINTGTASGRKIIGFERNQTGTGSGNYDRMLYIGTDGKIYAGCGTTLTAVSSSAPLLNNWHHVAATFLDTGNVLRLYVDGTESGTATGGTCLSYTGYWRLASYKLSGWSNASDGYYTGLIDEARVSYAIRNADWIRTEYNNQNDPCSFSTRGTEQLSPATQVTLVSFTATNYSGLVQLKWRTGYEVRNLGFKVYREDRGKLVKVTKSMVAGSALFARRGLALTAGRTYAWTDKLDDLTGAVRYWLEDVDLNGKSTWHGPITPEPGGPEVPDELRSTVLSELGKSGSQAHRQEYRWGASGQLDVEARGDFEPVSAAIRPMAQTPIFEATTGSLAVQWGLAAKSTIKILVNRSGWQRVTQPELLRAGLSAAADTAYLRLYADGVEQQMIVHGGANRRLGPADWIEFYGTALDTPWTDSRVYWLVADNRAGKRVPKVKSTGAYSTVDNYFTTVELRDRIIHWAGLLNGDAENFFGSVVSTDPDVETVTLHHAATDAPGMAQLELSLQGTTEIEHLVAIQVNGVDVGSLRFAAMEAGTARFTLPQSIFGSGENTITLTALNGEDDVSLVSYIRVSYWHTLEADDDTLQLTLTANQSLTIDGFSSADIRAIDVTNPLSLQEITGTIAPGSSGYAITVGVPGAGTKRLLLFTGSTMLNPAGIKANAPSSWNRQTAGAEVVMISHGDFIEALQDLKFQDQKEGYTVSVVDVEDVYDEFSYGAKTPYALRDFMSMARGIWKKKPRFLLLIGDASFDPRNYLGFGEIDYVPTKLIDTDYLETTSDDWFGDFNSDGISDIAVGRISVRTAAEAVAQVAKIVAYKRASKKSPESWARNVALVADINDGFDFEAASEGLRELIPRSLSVFEIFRGSVMDDALARSMILQNLQSGVLLMNYFGHGSVEIWRGDLLTSADAADLNSGTKLPFLVSMNCLNGLFADVYSESLAEAMMKAPRGGTVGVWASSGLSDPDWQLTMNKELYRQLFTSGLTVGEAVLKAKAATRNKDLRRTWILFGDPTLRLQYSAN